MTSAWWVRLGGTLPASEIAAHTAPTYETGADGGCLSASFALALTPRSQHQLLTKGTLVEVMCGPVPMWTGTLNEPDRTTWEVQASGLSASLRGYLAFDSGGNATRNVGFAVQHAIDEGWKGTNPFGTGLSSVVVPGDVSGAPVTVGQLLDDMCEWYPGGLRWGVTYRGTLYTAPPGTREPRWMAMPDAAAFGTTDENTATKLAGSYFDGTNTLTAYAGSGAPQEAVDLSEWGTITEADAEAILAGKLLRRGFTGWVNGTTLGRNQFRTLGGTPAFLGMVMGGETMRAHGLPYTVTQSLALDVEIGKTRYTAGEDSIYLEPINTAPRNLRAVIAAS